MRQNSIRNNEKHEKTAKILKLIGWLCLPLGLILLAFGIGSTFIGKFDLFFLGFIGMPLIWVGAICLMYGYQREMGEYASNRVMPIVADSANYLMEETADTTGEYVNTVLEKSGKNMGKILNQGFGQKEVVKIRCPYCKELNDENAKYCDNCGSKL